MQIKALSLTQPWASLIALGQKKIETRSWPTHYRGWLAIRAAKGLAGMTQHEYEQQCLQEPFLTALFPAYGSWLGSSIRSIATNMLPRGQIVAVVRQIACVPITRNYAEDLTAVERAFGNYTPGRYAHVYSDPIILPLTVPARGMQGLWDWEAPPEVQALLLDSATPPPDAGGRA